MFTASLIIEIFFGDNENHHQKYLINNSCPNAVGWKFELVSTRTCGPGLVSTIPFLSAFNAIFVK